MRPQNMPTRALPLTTTQLEAYRDLLREMADDIDQVAKFTKENEGKIATFNFPSGSAGIDRVRSFVNALMKSMQSAKLGKPTAVGERRSRYSPKTKSTDTKKATKKKS